MNNNNFQPNWTDNPKLESIKSILSSSPAIVFAGETRKLIQNLELAQKGEVFVLHAGECAEDFQNCRGSYIHEYIKVMTLASGFIQKRIDKEVCLIGRIAGQYAKPRSQQFEIVDGLSYPSYFGDIINGFEFDKRSFDPERMLKAYNCSVQTFNLIRAFMQGDYNINNYLDDVLEGEFIKELFDNQYISSMKEYLLKNGFSNKKSRSDFFISHEALLLDYESCFTRIDTTSNHMFNCSTHFLWLGERTRNLSSSHVQYLSQINNPIGIKVGPKFSSKELVKIIRLLNPENTAGKISIIARFGVNFVSSGLEKLIKVIHENRLVVTWFCDPMHGNTQIFNQVKTRDFSDILNEAKIFKKLLEGSNFHFGGIHLEITPLPVTECIDDNIGVKKEILDLNYCSKVDPRLNALQTLNLLKELF